MKWTNAEHLWPKHCSSNYDTLTVQLDLCTFTLLQQFSGHCQDLESVLIITLKQQ